MRCIFSRIINFQSIIVLLGTVMLLSCKNDVQDVNRIAVGDARPEMTGHELEMVYSDSARIKYKVITSEYIKMTEGKEKYEEFPKGLYAISYDKDGKMIGSIKCKYAKKFEEKNLWEARNEVVVVNEEGKKLETELLYWDVEKQIIYSDRYVKLTSGEQVIEGHKGFKSDQDMNNPMFYGITGKVEIDNKNIQ